MAGQPEQLPVKIPSEHALDLTGAVCRQVTGEEHCRARDELTHLGAIYQSYLSSRRRHQQLLQTYRGGGERSTRETAGLVGLKLPHDPR